MRSTVYILSGPAGVGKSTTAKHLVNSLERSAYISGDDISHMPVNGREKPWLNEQSLRLIWKNISSLTNNLIDAEFDVVIDYVTFPRELRWFIKELKVKNIRIIYVVLMVDVETLRYRDQLRPVENQMGERSSILLHEFKEALADQKHILHTNQFSTVHLEDIIQEIKSNSEYVVSACEEKEAECDE
jgi:tRNA uridine 5-carbamoylmethylation protein Kti12